MKQNFILLILALLAGFGCLTEKAFHIEVSKPFFSLNGLQALDDVKNYRELHDSGLYDLNIYYLSGQDKAILKLYHQSNLLDTLSIMVKGVNSIERINFNQVAISYDSGGGSGTSSDSQNIYGIVDDSLKLLFFNNYQYTFYFPSLNDSSESKEKIDRGIHINRIVVGHGNNCNSGILLKTTYESIFDGVNFNTNIQTDVDSMWFDTTILEWKVK